MAWIGSRRSVQCRLEVAARGELAPPQFDATLNDVARPFSRLVPLDRLIRPAAALTLELDHPVYDCLYLALAHSEALAVVTADQGLLAAVRGTVWAGRVSRL